MPQETSDEDFAKFALQSLMATAEQIAAARKFQSVSAELGTPMTLPAALVEQGVITAAQRDAVEQKLRTEREKANRLGPYKIVRKIGEGGMGSVYLAEDPAEGRRVALKVIARKNLKDPSFMGRFQREAEAAIKLNHVNIARAFSVGEDRGLPYYVMEYCEGETLKETLRRDSSLPPPRATALVIQIARGLQYAHESGFIHRDVKPENIMLGPNDVAKLLDLGLSKNIEDAEQSFRTVSGVAIGTPHYIAPEQARGERTIDGRADIYSLGATYYHLVTGDTPFHGSSSYEIITKHLTEQLPDPRDLREDIPEGVVEVIRKMMAKKPEHRYQDCRSLLADLELVADGKAPTTMALSAELSSIALPKVKRFRGVRKSTVRKERSAAPGLSRRQVMILGGLVGGILAVVILIVLKLNGERPGPTESPRLVSAPVPVAAAPPPAPAPAPPTVKREPQPPPAPTPLSADDLREVRAKQRFFEIQELERSGRITASEIRAIYESFVQEFEGTATAGSARDWLKATGAAATPAPAPPAPPKEPSQTARPPARPPIPPPDFGDDGWKGAFDLLGYIDPEKDLVSGTWQGRRLSSGPTGDARLELPYQPPEEYDLRIGFTRIRGNDVNVILSHSGRSFEWMMGGSLNTVSGFELIRGERATINPTVLRAGGLVDGRPYTLILQVRNAGVAAYLDGRFQVGWSTDYRDMSISPEWRLRTASALGLGVVGEAQFRKMEVLEIKGEGVLKKRERPSEAKSPAPARPKADFPALSAQALKTVWGALVEKNAVLQKQAVLLKKPGIGECKYAIKNVTPKGLILEMQFGGGTVESQEKPETLPVDVLTSLVQKASLQTNPDIRKAEVVLWAGSGAFDPAYQELAKAKGEGVDVGDLPLAVAEEELARVIGKSSPADRLGTRKSLLSQRGTAWPAELRERVSLEIAAEERENQRAEGPLGGRFGDHLALLKRGGGGRDTEDAVEAALLWLARHQGPDGNWSADAFARQCTGGPCGGIGMTSYDTGLTSLAVLAFLGAGIAPGSAREVPDPMKPGRTRKFGETVEKGIDWLLSRQDVEGCIGERGVKYMYNHAIAALVLSEAYAMTQSPPLKAPAQRAINFLVMAQNPERGWRYSVKCGDNDTSVTGWAVMALKSAELADLDFPSSAYDGALTWLNEATEPASPFQTGYNARGTGKVYVPGKNENFDHHPAMSAVAVLSKIFIRKRRAEWSISAVNLLLSDLPEWRTNRTDFYYWYYGSLAAFQYDGPDGPTWKRWAGPMKNALVPNQHARGDGCRYGSWDSDLERWGSEGGRVYATALNALTLETYYRYAPVKTK